MILIERDLIISEPGIAYGHEGSGPCSVKALSFPEDSAGHQYKTNLQLMDIQSHKTGGKAIAEVVSDDIIVHNTDDALDLLGNIYYQGFDCLILHRKNITTDFFDLKNKMAGDILQKFSNYRVRLAIVGDFSAFSSKSLKDFIYESNKGKHVNFVASVREVLEAFSTGS